MRLLPIASLALLAPLALSVAVSAAPRLPPGAERWSATSSTAMAITGDIVLSPTRFEAAGKALPLAVAADVPAFGTDRGPKRARILRVTRPADLKLLNGNTLCGVPVRWIVAYRERGGEDLNLSVFSRVAHPAGENDDGLCGTFLYSR